MANDKPYMDFNSTEIAICLEDTETGVGKFFLPAITPMLSSDVPYIKDGLPVDTSNILSDINTADITPCKESNYIELSVPGGKAKKGDRFSITFIGGGIDDAILGQRI